MASPRIYLAGRVSLECGVQLVDERHVPGRQGRLALAFLILNRHRPMGRDELVTAIWGDSPPAEIESALSAILSRLRTVFKKAGLPPGEAGIDVRLGAIELRLPADTWIDLEEAANALDQAEGALRAGKTATAWSLANVVVSVTRRPFLGEEESPWIQERRTMLRKQLARGLRCLSEVSAANGEGSLAVQYAQEVVTLEPFQETAYQQLMRMHAQMGNRAEALRVFGQCRELLREELGASPSPQTEAVFLEILKQ